MAKWIACMALCALMLFGARTAQPAPAQPDGTGVANCVDIYLPENPSTAYLWRYAVEDPALVSLRDQFFADGELFAVGRGGMHWFQINGEQPGVTSVTFTLSRFETDPIEQAVTYRLTVEDDLDVVIWGVEME